MLRIIYLYHPMRYILRVSQEDIMPESTTLDKVRAVLRDPSVLPTVVLSIGAATILGGFAWLLVMPPTRTGFFAFGVAYALELVAFVLVTLRYYRLNPEARETLPISHVIRYVFAFLTWSGMNFGAGFLMRYIEILTQNIS
jgi:hypothetical protein